MNKKNEVPLTPKSFDATGLRCCQTILQYSMGTSEGLSISPSSFGYLQFYFQSLFPKIQGRISLVTKTLKLDKIFQVFCSSTIQWVNIPNKTWQDFPFSTLLLFFLSRVIAPELFFSITTALRAKLLHCSFLLGLFHLLRAKPLCLTKALPQSSPAEHQPPQSRLALRGN